MNNIEKEQTIALSLVDGIGAAGARKLLDYYGDCDSIFGLSAAKLSKDSGISETKAADILSQLHTHIKEAVKDREYYESEGIELLRYDDERYPDRLKECSDQPLLLYVKGNIDFNKGKFLSVVGTRNSSEYGRNVCRNIITGLATKHHDIVIVSGLAFGIDICAHKSAIENNLTTIAIMANGINHIYPNQHRDTARIIMENGALATEFRRGIYPASFNFARRNRIIAGISDATLVVESANKGGSIITADMAISYNRELFAIPGRIGDSFSEGCNNLIRYQKASLVQSAEDIEYMMGWCKNTRQSREANTCKPESNIDMSPDERIIYSIIQKENTLHKDILAGMTSFGSELSSRLLTMEFKGIIKCLPGNFYTLA